jgi:hypothetical protein
LLGPIAAVLIGRFGWHGAYYGLAVVAFVVGFIPVSIFLRDPPAIEKSLAATGDAGSILPGLNGEGEDHSMIHCVGNQQ